MYFSITMFLSKLSSIGTESGSRQNVFKYGVICTSHTDGTPLRSIYIAYTFGQQRFAEIPVNTR